MHVGLYARWTLCTLDTVGHACTIGPWAKVRLQLRQQIRALQTRLHITTVFINDDQEEALSMAGRVSVMCSGRIERIDSPAVLYSDPAAQLVAEFVGTMNRVPGHLERSGISVMGAVVPVQGGVDWPQGIPVGVLVRLRAPVELWVTATEVMVTEPRSVQIDLGPTLGSGPP